MPLEPWETLNSEYLIQDRWLTLRADRCRTSSGLVVEPYYVLEQPDWVHVAAFDSQNRLLLIRQYRHARQEMIWELPCGAMEPGEEPAQAMLRELREETGAALESYQALPPMSSNPARSTNTVYSFLGFGAHIAGEQELDEAEEIEFSFHPVERVLEMIDNGQFSQALHIATIHLALRQLKGEISPC